MYTYTFSRGIADRRNVKDEKVRTVVVTQILARCLLCRSLRIKLSYVSDSCVDVSTAASE